MRTVRVALAGLLLLACDDAPSTAHEGEAPDAAVVTDAGPEAPSCATTLRYDPVGAPERLTSFPDDYWTVADGETLTGRRVRIDAESAPWLAEIPANFAEIFTDMSTLDGFGTSAPVFLEFEGALPDLPEMHDAVRLLDLGDDVPVEVPYEPVVLDDGQTLALWPALPMRGRTPHAVVVTTDLRDADGGCIAPSPALRSLLTGTAEGPLAELAPRYASLLAKAELGADEIAAAAVWTTQSVHASSQAVAADIEGRKYQWTAPPTCAPAGDQVHCEGTFAAGDYRTDGVVQGATPAQTYEVPVSMWFPAEGDGPWPTYVVGHGLGGDRSLGGFVSRLTGASPITVVAIDAVAHGEHPGGVGNNQVDLLTRFFAVDILSRRVEALKLRDNFRQSTFDKLQLLQLILGNADFDGDGRPEVDVDRVGYFGFSLGGIMGSEFLALSKQIRTSILGMPGGRLSQIMRDSAAFETLINIFVPPGTSGGWRHRMFGAVQTVGERGDPVNYAPHVLQNRLRSMDQPPHVLMVMALSDQIVPNTSTEALVRAYQMPLAQPVYRGVPFLPEPVELPARATVAGQTAALVQHRQVSEQDTTGLVRRQPATHENVMLGRETIHQVRTFHQTWLDNGVPDIVPGSGAFD